MRLIIWYAGRMRHAWRFWFVPLCALVACVLLLTTCTVVWPVFSVGIDAGHGGKDPGAIGSAGLREKDVTLQVTTMVAEMLAAAGEAVVLTRDGDTRLGNSQRSDLQARVRIANSNSVDLLLSIHCNGFHMSSVRGPRTYYQPGSDSGRQLAVAVQSRLRETIGYGRKEPIAEDHLVTRESKMTAVIVEIGYITNPGEERMLGSVSFQRKIAQAIVEGVKDYAAAVGLS